MDVNSFTPFEDNSIIYTPKGETTKDITPLLE